MIPIANPEITELEKNKVMKVLDSGMLASGPRVKEFNNKFAEFVGADYGIATTSGTTALDVAVKATGLKEGDKVITTPFTFIASCNSLLYNGVEPIFVDIDPVTYNIDPYKALQKLEEDPEIKGIMPVHLFGQPADMDTIMRLAEKYDLVVIEDAAQAHGAEFAGETVGSIGTAGIFSFYPTKNMTTGEGGIVVTSNEKVANKAELLINHGLTDRYYHEELGYNYRMTDIAAAIGLEQLKKLKDFNRMRRENALKLTEGISDLDWLVTPKIAEKRSHVFHQYTIRVTNGLRDDFVDYLQDNGIGYGIHYPRLAYQQPIYKKLGYNNFECLEAEKASKQVVSLPVYPALTDENINQIIKVLQAYNPGK
ncbi:MAG: DegT/DnrJ/EryC1/StrS family aminotransferase [Halarsenatibacteraceae bacterium]